MAVFDFTGRLWCHEGDAAWHFVTLPHDVADDIGQRTDSSRPGFGSVRVTVTIGTTTWPTSLFPDASSKSYVLPVKKAVRQAEDLDAGDDVTVRLRLLRHRPRSHNTGR